MAGAEVIIFDIDSPGGRVDLMEEIARQITETEQVETVAVRATYTEPLARREVKVPEPEPAPTETRTVDAHSFAKGTRETFAIVPRTTIAGPLDGPCIVTETTSTLYVDDGWTICPGDRGELILDRKEA